MKPKHAGGPLALIALLLTTISAAGCASSPEPVYITRTVEVVRDRYVPVDSWLTQPVEVPALSENFDVWELGAVAKQRELRLLQCNDQLSLIASLKENPADP